MKPRTSSLPPGRQRERADAQWAAFKARSDARAAAWARGEGFEGVARWRKRRREMRQRARPAIALEAPLTPAEKAQDSLGNYELALAEIRRRS